MTTGCPTCARDQLLQAIAAFAAGDKAAVIQHMREAETEIGGRTAHFIRSERLRYEAEALNQPNIAYWLGAIGATWSTPVSSATPNEQTYVPSPCKQCPGNN